MLIKYTLDEATSHLTLTFDDDTVFDCFYTAYVYGALVLFIRSENDSSVQYIVLSPAYS